MITKLVAPNDGRLGELAEWLADEQFALGPLDRDDLRGAICELIERRIAETRHSEKVAA